MGQTKTGLVGVQGGILSRRTCGARSSEMKAVLGTHIALFGGVLGHGCWGQKVGEKRSCVGTLKALLRGQRDSEAVERP